MNTPTHNCALPTSPHSIVSLGGTKLWIGEHERKAHQCHSPGQSTHHLSLVLEADGGRIRQHRSGKAFDWVPQAGDISIIPANSDGHCHSQAWTRRIVVQLPPQFLDGVAHEAFPSQALNLSVRFAARDETLQKLILLLYSEARQQTGARPVQGDGLLFDSLTTALAVQLLRQHAEQHEAMEEPTCELCGGLSLRAQRQVLEYISDHLTGDVSLEAMARLVGLSRYHFIRAFKSSLGLTPHQYVVQQRVEKAKQLMATSRYPLREIAQMSGFADQSHFTRHFRRLTGTTPKAFAST